MYKKGFTLIELLVVIAIIGILSSVILSSLNSARGKGANAAVRASLTNLRSQATIYFDDNNQSYADVCNNTDILFMLENASSSGAGMSGCASDAESWSAYARFKVSEEGNDYWCINSTGFSNAMATITEPWTTSSCQ